MHIISFNVKEGSSLEPLVAFNCGHDYKMSQIFGECEKINRVLQRREHKTLRARLCQLSLPYSILMPVGDACRIQGLLAGWRPFGGLLPNNKVM